MHKTFLISLSRLKHLLEKFLPEKAFAGQVSAVFSLNVVNRLLTFVLFICISRMIGVAEFGEYALAWSWLQILLIPAKFGMDAAAVRFQAAYRSEENWSLFQGHWRYSARFVIAASLGVCLLASAAALGILGESMRGTFLIAFAMLPVFALIFLFRAALRAVDLPLAGQAPETLLRPILQLFLLAALFLLTSFHTAEAVMTATLFSMIATLAVMAFYLTRAHRNFAPEAPQYRGPEWLSYGFFMVLSSGFMTVQQQTDIVMIGALLGAEEAGLYTVAQRIAMLAGFVLMAANYIVSSRISALHASCEKTALQKLLTQCALLIFFGTIAITAFAALFAEFLLGLFGQEFTASSNALYLLLAGQVVTALAGPVGNLMVMTDYHRQAMYILSFTVAFNIAANYVLIGMFGIEGSAMATAVTSVLWSLGALLYITKKLGLDPSVFAVFRRASG